MMPVEFGKVFESLQGMLNDASFGYFQNGYSTQAKQERA